MKPGQTLFDITSRVLLGMDELLRKESPDLVLVQGDTTTVFATALAAFYRKIPVGHVEAGLRTYVRYNPFPEEMNRVLTSHLALLHFAPTERARRNLLAEGIAETAVFVTGNPVIDALQSVVRSDYTFQDPALKKLNLDRQRLVTVTTHRRESWGDAMREGLQAIREIVETHSELVAVFPVHLSPHERKAAEEILGGAERFLRIDPLPYLDFAHLMARSTLIFTDSGGVQEEAPTFGVPVLVLRETTERPEGIEAGTAKLVGTDRKRILDTAWSLLNDPSEYERMAQAANPYGDGQAAGRIVDAIESWREVQGAGSQSKDRAK
jgi:UDP-N-acetylglucosamine 2-epimerase (non-hydrolysing)